MSFAQQWWRRARQVSATIDPLEDFDPEEVKRVKDFLRTRTEERIEIFKFLMEQYR